MSILAKGLPNKISRDKGKVLAFLSAPKPQEAKHFKAREPSLQISHCTGPKLWSHFFVAIRWLQKQFVESKTSQVKRISRDQVFRFEKKNRINAREEELPIQGARHQGHNN